MTLRHPSVLHTLQLRRILQSDYVLAKPVGILPQTISDYRYGRTQMADEIAVAMAAMIDRPPASILAQIAADRAKSPEVAKIWREPAKRLRGADGLASRRLRRLAD